jgi:hypothetical protein
MPDQFLVSTTNYLLAVEPESHKLWRIHSGGGLYYGLARGANGLLYAARRNCVIGPTDPGARSSEEGSILVFDRDFKQCDELRPKFALRDVHGIAYLDGRLWVTCSYDNMVAIYDTKARDWDRWYPAPNPAHRDSDIHHFNTIRFIDGRVYLIAHNFGPSLLLSYHYPSLQLESTTPLGLTSHDLFLFENAFATCSSGEGVIVNTSGDRLRTGSFPRGLAMTPEGNLLGMSMSTPRDKRPLQDGILRWYSSGWQFRTDFVLPRVGMVLDILSLGKHEYHLGSVDPWSSSEIIPGEYNRLAPGNVYLPNSFASSNLGTSLEWHASEGTHSWAAARNATISILVNPGESRLRVEVSSANPNPYCGEIWLDDQYLGLAAFNVPGVQSLEFRIPSISRRAASLSFRVPYLWRPAELIPGSTDQRLIGLAVHSVTLSCNARLLLTQGATDKRGGYSEIEIMPRLEPATVPR